MNNAEQLTARWRHPVDMNRLLQFLLARFPAQDIAEFIVIDHGDAERAAFAAAVKAATEGAPEE